MEIIPKLTLFSLVLLKSEHFDVEKFVLKNCERDILSYPENYSKLRCYDVIFDTNQRYDIQNKDFEISNSSEISFVKSEIDLLNGRFLDKFPTTEILEFINSTITISSRSANESYKYEKLKILVFQKCYVENLVNSTLSIRSLQKLLITSSNFSRPTLEKDLLNFGSSLTIIYMVHTNLHSISENAFDNLVNLRELTITKSFLMQLPLKLFVNNQNLKFLDLSKNFFDEIPNIEYPESLEDLKFWSNFIKRLERNNFKYLKNLKGLKLQGNYIKNFYVDTFWDLDKLEDLVLTKNLIDDISWKHFIFCRKLQWLDIDENFLDKGALVKSRIPNIKFDPQRKRKSEIGNTLKNILLILFWY